MFTFHDQNICFSQFVCLNRAVRVLLLLVRHWAKYFIRYLYSSVLYNISISKYIDLGEFERDSVTSQSTQICLAYNSNTEFPLNPVLKIFHFGRLDQIQFFTSL